MLERESSCGHQIADPSNVLELKSGAEHIGYCSKPCILGRSRHQSLFKSFSQIQESYIKIYQEPSSPSDCGAHQKTNWEPRYYQILKICINGSLGASFPLSEPGKKRKYCSLIYRFEELQQFLRGQRRILFQVCTLFSCRSLTHFGKGRRWGIDTVLSRSSDISLFPSFSKSLVNICPSCSQLSQNVQYLPATFFIFGPQLVILCLKYRATGRDLINISLHTDLFRVWKINNIK